MVSLIRIRASHIVERVTRKYSFSVFVFRKAIAKSQHIGRVFRLEGIYLFRMTLLRFKKLRLDCKVFALYFQCLLFYRKYHVADPPISNRFIKLCYKVYKCFDRRHNGWGLSD